MLSHTDSGFLYALVVIDLRRRTTGATGNNRISRETSGTPSERKHLDEDCVENDDRKETSGADTNHHTVDGGWSCLLVYTHQIQT